MALNWHLFYGGFNNTGPYNNVILCGTPNRYGYFGEDLQRAHEAGYGRGIGFEADGYDVNVYLDLVGISVTDAGVYLENSGSYAYSTNPYQWLFKIEFSNNNQSSYGTYYDGVIFSHSSQYTKIYSMKGIPDRYGNIPQYDWTTMAANCQYHRKIEIPKDTTHVRFSIRGSNATFPYEIVFTIEEIVEEYRPMAIRKSSNWQSLDNDHAYWQVRRSDKWVDIPLMQYSQDAVENEGTSRIRKNNKWLGQSRFGK